MLSNAYFLAKFRFDTAENEPAKNLQNFAKFANFADPTLLTPGMDELKPWGSKQPCQGHQGAAEGPRTAAGPPTRARRSPQPRAEGGQPIPRPSSR